MDCKPFLNLKFSYLGRESFYPSFENYPAINVDNVSAIPNDYDGVMGVPVTFLTKWSRGQFELVGLGVSNLGLEAGVKPYSLEHKKLRRVFVDGGLYTVKEGVVKVPFARVLIRRIK